MSFLRLNSTLPSPPIPLIYQTLKNAPALKAIIFAANLLFTIYFWILKSESNFLIIGIKRISDVHILIRLSEKISFL